MKHRGIGEYVKKQIEEKKGVRGEYEKKTKLNIGFFTHMDGHNYKPVSGFLKITYYYLNYSLHYFKYKVCLRLKNLKKTKKEESFFDCWHRREVRQHTI